MFLSATSLPIRSYSSYTASAYRLRFPVHCPRSFLPFRGMTLPLRHLYCIDISLTHPSSLLQVLSTCPGTTLRHLYCGISLTHPSSLPQVLSTFREHDIIFETTPSVADGSSFNSRTFTCSNRSESFSFGSRSDSFSSSNQA